MNKLEFIQALNDNATILSINSGPVMKADVNSKKTYEIRLSVTDMLTRTSHTDRTLLFYVMDEGTENERTFCNNRELMNGPSQDFIDYLENNYEDFNFSDENWSRKDYYKVNVDFVESGLLKSKKILLRYDDTKHIEEIDLA